MQDTYYQRSEPSVTLRSRSRTFGKKYVKVFRRKARFRRAALSCYSSYYIFFISPRKRVVVFTIVQIIFHFLWDHWAHYGTFKDGVLIMYTLEGVSSVANFITAYEESK